MNPFRIKLWQIPTCGLACALAVGCADNRLPDGRTDIGRPTEQEVEVPPAEEGSELIANRLTKLDDETDELANSVEPAQTPFAGVILEVSSETIRLQNTDGQTQLFALAEDVAVVSANNNAERMLVTELKPGQQVRLIIERIDQDSGGVIQVVREIHMNPTPTTEENS
jgi:hypothetical protein